MLHDSSLIQNVSDIRLSDSAHPMRDRNASFAARNLFERLLNERFGLRIDRRRGLIEDEDRGILEKCASNR